MIAIDTDDLSRALRIARMTAKCDCQEKGGDVENHFATIICNNYDRMADEIAELRAKIAKKDEVISGLIEVLGVSVDETSEFREFVSMVAAGDSASNEVKSFMIHTYIHNAKQLLNK